jgi:hypothetical protein
MRLYRAITFPSLALCALASTALAASSGPRFYGDPPDDHHPWAVHDGNRPQPKIVTPGTFSTPEQAGKPPSDAVILFDGTDLSKWQGDKGDAQWKVENGYMEVVAGTGQIRTREGFGDCQLHVEFATPKKVEGSSQGRGNSGVFLMGAVEIQVLDSYDNITYADGHAGSVYGVNPAMANVIKPPGEFNVYDIVFRRPIWKDGKEVDPGYVTVFINGGGTDGYLSTEATMAKRKEIAAQIRHDAEGLSGTSQMLRYLESLVYEKNETAEQKVKELGNQYVASLKGLPNDQLQSKKDEVKSISGNFKYMSKFNLLPATFEPAAALDALIKEQRWDQEKKKK